MSCEQFADAKSLILPEERAGVDEKILQKVNELDLENSPIPTRRVDIQAANIAILEDILDILRAAFVPLSQVPADVESHK